MLVVHRLLLVVKLVMTGKTVTQVVLEFPVNLDVGMAVVEEVQKEVQTLAWLLVLEERVVCLEAAAVAVEEHIPIRYLMLLRCLQQPLTLLLPKQKLVVLLRQMEIVPTILKWIYHLMLVRMQIK